MSEFKSTESDIILPSKTGETLFDFDVIEPQTPPPRVMSDILATPPYIPEERKSVAWDETGSHDIFDPTKYDPSQQAELTRISPEKKTARRTKRTETLQELGRRFNLTGTASRTDEQNEGIASALDDSTRYTRENLVRSGLSPNHAAAIMIARALKKAKNR